MQRTLGIYRFKDRKIGQGAHSQVFKGYNSETGRAVAIKRIDMKMMQEYAYLIEREVDIMRSVDHPNIIKLYDVIREGNYIYLIMEYCKYGDLAKYIKERPLTEAYAKKYASQLVSALHYLLDRNIMHRDIKPHNILVWDKNTIKLSDFGLARIYEEFSLMETICGSPLYMAPEICREDKYDVKSDIWSLGVLLYEMVTGRPPYKARSKTELMSLIRKENFKFPAYPVISAECKDLICRLLQKDVMHRIDWEQLYQHPWLELNIPRTYPTDTECNNVMDAIEVAIHTRQDLAVVSPFYPFPSNPVQNETSEDFDMEDMFTNEFDVPAPHPSHSPHPHPSHSPHPSHPALQDETPYHTALGNFSPANSYIMNESNYDKLPAEVFYDKDAIEAGFMLVEIPPNQPIASPSSVVGVLSERAMGYVSGSYYTLKHKVMSYLTKP